MKCVNRSSKDFKFLAQHYDVSVGTLEYITHKYWQETGSEDYFPSEIYIRKQIGRGQYEEHNKDVRDLWESNYSTPQEFQSREALESAYEKALKFFPTEAVSFHESFKGNYILTVKKPVAKVKPSINDYSNRKSFDTQEWADFNLVTNGDYRTTTEQMAVDEEGRPVELIEREIVKEQLQHMENMLLPVRYRDSFEDYFAKYPNSFLQQAVGDIYEIDINYHNSEYKTDGDTTLEEILEIVKAKKYNKSGTDAVTIDKDDHQVIYTIDHSTNKELEDNLKLGDGFGIRHTYNLEDLNGENGEELVRQLIRDIAADYGYSETRIRKVLQNLGIRPENMLGSNLAAELKGMSDDNALVSGLGRRKRNKSGYDPGSKSGRENKEGIRQTKEDLFITPEGEIYGFVGVDGNIYLDEDIIRPEHPIHEYTHLWDRVIAQRNPELWKRGIALMKKTSLWEEYANHDQYGKKWKATKGMTDEKFDALVASEVHARLTGKEGERLLKDEAKKKRAKGVIGRLRNWLLEVFKELKATFSDWSKEEINKLTLDDFVNMTVRDFFDGVNFRERNGKQEFTFKDGITVTAPFSPNFQQVDALNFMSDFVNSHETSMTLAGYAGTGKTSIMEMLAQKMRKQGKQVVFTATTNQAARVLGERVKKSGFETTTLHKAFGINVKVDEEQAYDERNTKQEASGKVRMLPGATVIIDESSMIDEKSYKTINDIARQNGLKIIYVGDPAQLPPVGENKISIVFRENNGNMRTLTIVERTGDNAILKEATNLRSSKPLSGESDFNKEGKGVAYISQSNKGELRKIVEKFAPELKDNPNIFRILAFTNKAVTSYNEAVRTAMGYTDETPRVNEPIVGYNNWGEEYDPYTKETKYRFINSGSYRIIKVNPKTTVTYHRPLADGTIAELEASPIVIEDSQGKTQELNLIDIKHNPRNLQTAIQLAKEKDRLAKEASIAWKARQVQQFAMLKGQMRDIEKFLFVNDVIAIPDKKAKDGKRILQKKVFDYGYAMTVHKSQGSTFTHVMMDDIDISTAKNQRKRDSSPFMGTPIELEDSNTEGVSMNNTDFGEVADFFGEGIEAEGNEIQKETSDDADLRQQLRYVAVSRATDTVTIISSNIKSEDSPLNHIKKARQGVEIYEDGTTSQNDNTINQQESRSNKIVNLISATIAPYFNTSYEDYVAMTSEEQKEMREAFAKAAKEVAKALGINLDMKEASFNIGGYEFDDGGSVVEPSFTFKLNTTPENARLFAALMGDLGYEQQEAVVSNYDIDDRDNADGIRFSLEFKDSDTLLKLINQFGIKNFTYDKTNGILSVLSFDTADVEKFHNLVQQLKENGYDKESETFYFKSSYNGRTGRKTLYGKWLKAQERNSQGIQPELYSLVQEALKKVNYYSGKPSNYEGLIEPDEDTVFVFGSNPEGIHGAGAAAVAKSQFGAIQGQGEGMQGNSYALPTKDLKKANGTRWYRPGKKEETEVKEWYKSHDYSEIQNHPLNAERTMTPQQIIGSIKKLYETAEKNPDKLFKVSHYPFGQLSLNGYLGEEMLAMFKQAGEIPSNVVFNKEWTDHWDEIQSSPSSTTVGQPTFNPSEVFNMPTSDKVETEDVMKAWRSDPSRENITRRVYLKGQKERGYFELVKDEEEDNYSVHFKPTDSKNPDAFNQEEKTILFQAIADMIPEGGRLSTWGELSKGGIAGLERFSKLGFTKTGEREIKMKGTGKEITIPVYTKNTTDSIPAQIEEKLENALPSDKLTVWLPGYEHFKKLSESITVDDAWKIDRLKELDQMLSTENTNQENEEILLRMEKVIDALDEETYYGNTNKQKTAVLEKKLGTLGKINKQIRRVQESNRIPQSEVPHIAELVMNAVSDIVSDIQKNPELADEWFPMVKTEMDFKTATRKEIIETITLDRLLDRVKELFNSEEVDFDPSTGLQADVIYDNFMGIVQFGTNIFAMNEGFGLKKNYRNDSYEITESAHLSTDDFNTPQDTATVEELEGDEQEHWMIEQRTVEVLNSATELVRMAIHDCYMVDMQGNPIESKWHIKERMNPRKAVYSILAWTRGSLTLPDMISKLSEKQKSHKWLGQLVERLRDTSGNEADFQSQFFNTMCKSRQRYSITQLVDGRFIARSVNEHPSSTVAMNSIKAQFNMGEYPLFIDENGNRGKVNEWMLGSNKTIDSDTFNLHKGLSELKEIIDALDKGTELSEEMKQKAQDNIQAVCTVIGFYPEVETINEAMTPENIKTMTDKLGFLVADLDKMLSEQKANPDIAPFKPFEYRGANDISGTIGNFIKPITELMDEVDPNMVYEDGKMYQQYVTPSYLSLLIEKFHGDSDYVRSFMDRAYGQSQWFKTKKQGWRFDWLEKLASDQKSRDIFAHTVELNFNKHRYMKNMTPEEYTLSMFAGYGFGSIDKDSTMVPSWYRVPIQSNKPSNEYIRFWSYRGDNYKESILNGGYNAKTQGKVRPGGIYAIYLQELSRIDTVRKRNKKKGDAGFIKNFDTLGREFCYLPFLNAYLKDGKGGVILKDAEGNVSESNAELARLLQQKVAAEKALTADEEARLMTLVQDAIRTHLEEKTQSILEGWERKGILEAAKSIEGMSNKDEEVRASLENFIWNDHFAALNILEMTIGDIACYKDAEDLQKRLAQLHAPGIRANIYATDYEGNRVSDGVYRTLVLKDFDSFVSNLIANLNEMFDRKIASAPDIAAREYWKNLKHRLTRPRTYNEDGSVKDQGGDYWNINVADAQGFSSPASYRKKALMFGRWSQKAENIYQRLLKGEYRFDDLDTAFQPLKPFVYAQLHKNMGVDNAPIQVMPIPFQAKNAEYLLIMADAMLQGEHTSRPNLLRAIYRIMQDSEERFPTKGIDTVQFESAIKSGLQTPIDLNQFLDREAGEEGAYALLHNLMYRTDDKGNLVYNVDSYVYEAPYENYCLQQEIPAHFKNHQQSQGSQERMIIPSDLEFADQEKARQYRSGIENITAENINLSVKEFREELKLDSGDKRLKNLALSEILQREVLDSSRYGVDMFLACGINENTGDFVIPKGDPIQAKRVEQLINSLIKKRINNQEIAGGPIVQVSNWGTSRQLHIRFHTKDGGILMTEEEYKQKHPDKSYADYVRENQAGVAYYEVFAPIWAKDIFKKFADKDGIIDVGAIELLAPELLKMISYRIPTEDKYSIAPMKLMGFLPKEAGDGIMFPYELTGIDDSDFDVDKRYVMLWDYQIASRVEPKENESMTDAEKSYIQNNRKSIVNELAKAINLTAKASASEIEEIEKEVNAEAESKVKTATRIHNERLEAIERRNSMAEDAIDDTEFSKNEEKNEEIYDKKVEKLEKQYDKAIAKEEQNYQEKLANIEQERINNLSNKVSELERQKVKGKINKFLDEDRFENSSHDDALTRAIRKAYLNYMYKVVPNPDKRAQNNNKILDLTWDVLTDESMAHQLLNPGGFEDWKNAGYKIAAYKANPNATWEELGELENGDLSKMFKQQHDLTFVDAQIQFYKQNAAAASLLGIFAVNKIAHATLEADHLLIAVDEFCSGVDENHPIRIAGFTFGGYRDKDGKPLMSLSEFKEAKKEQPKVYEHMEYGDYLTLNADPRFTNRMFIDPRYDKNGKLVGKTLGSGVGASADAAKDPFLDLINVNLSTINVMTTMLRLGMPFEDAALFLSQGVLSEVLEEFNKENLTGWASLGSVISAKLADIAERNNIGENASIESEELSKEELIKGLRDADRREETDYKVLKTFQRLQALAEGMRNPTFATRFNSVSSAVGPLIIDNLILENKRDNFKLGKRDSTGFYTIEGDVVDIEYIFELHPILKAFAQTLDIAEEMFRDMPAGSTGFRNLLKKLPDGIKYKIFSNKDLFNDLSNFYQSHMLINAGMVDPSKLKYYIEEFPKKFVSNKYKEKYRDNPFVKAVSFTTSSKTGRTFLNVDVVSKSQPEKDVYSSGLVDLYKENPELALDLFNYFFFRGGINFTPKTAMGLFPTYVKEHLSTAKENGDKVSYIDVYRRMLSASPEIIIDQFLRNNWNEGRLVPKFKGKFEVTYENKKPVRLIISNPEDVQNMADVLYMKTTIDKKTYLWKLMGNANDAENSNRLVFEVTTPLGDNSEYLEMDVKNIEKPMSDTALDIEDTNSTELQAEGPANPDGAINDTLVEQVDLDGDKFRDALLAWRKASDPSYTQEKADALNNTIKTNPEKFGNIIKTVFDSMGIHRSEKEAVEFYKKLC